MIDLKDYNCICFSQAYDSGRHPTIMACANMGSRCLQMQCNSTPYPRLCYPGK